MEYEKSLEIVGKHGLHLKPSSELINIKRKLEGEYGVNITIFYKEEIIPHAIYLLSRGLEKGDFLKVKVNGNSGKEALESLVKLLPSELQYKEIC